MSILSESTKAGEIYTESRKKVLFDRIAQGINPYPNKWHVTKNLEQFRDAYNHLQNEEDVFTDESVAGRVMSFRGSGKLYFVDIQTITSNGVYNLQLMFSLKNSTTPNNADAFKKEVEIIARGDIIGVSGYPHRSKRGELSLMVKSFIIISPCLRMLPSAFFGLKDPSERIHNRVLDLIINKDSVHPFLIRHKMMIFLRNYLNARGYVEVNTPILGTIYGGATAAPFITYHNDLKQEMFMRISPELNLKRAIIGGLERVYEIGPQFRNESIDATHNPEFESIELYEKYADYYDLMTMTEDLLSSMIKDITGDYKLKYQPRDSDKEIILDFTPPFQRYDMLEEIERGIGQKLPEDLTTEEARLELIALCTKFNIECKTPQTTSRLIDKLCGHFVERHCSGVAFIINHPIIMSPLAKPHRDNQKVTERFELFVHGSELANAFTEQNNVFQQEQAFKNQQHDRAMGDKESQPYDQSYIDAMCLGLSATGGLGIGLTRLVMFLSNRNNIMDVILFPPYKA